jgi:hypothetical protein
VGDTAKVYNISTGDIIDGRKINADMVSILEDLLERARSGEIVSIACAYTYHDNSASQRLAGMASFQLLGALHKAASTLNAAL